MNLNDFITKYDGKVVRGGQCGELVRQYWIDVDKTVPPSYPNSKDYWYNPVPGYDKVQDPRPGDIAIYDGHGAYTEGHSAIYVDGRVFEQNADPNGSPAHLYNRNNTYLLGYLRKQGESMTLDEAQKLYEALDATNKRLDKVEASLDSLYKIVDTLQKNVGNISGGSANGTYELKKVG